MIRNTERTPILKQLYNAHLTRDMSGTKQYDLGDDNLNKIFDIKGREITLQPGQQSIIAFASANILFGVLGYAVEAFTYTPAGYVVTYSAGEQHLTVVINNQQNDYYREKLIEFANAQYFKDIPGGEKEYYLAMQELLKDNNLTISEICFLLNEIVKEEDLIHIEEKINHAIEPMQSGKGHEQAVNEQNCINNHLFLDDMCIKHLGLQKDKMADDDWKRVAQLRDHILNSYIIPGYLTYAGHDRGGNPLERDSQILNDMSRLNSLKDLQGNIIEDQQFVTAIYNMSSTDYTADTVCAIMQLMHTSKSALQGLETLSALAPDTPNNPTQVLQARKYLHDKWDKMSIR